MNNGPIFFKLYLAVLLSLQRCKSKIWVKTVKPFGCTKRLGVLQLPVSYCVSLIMVTITRHVFINIVQTEHFSAAKFDMGYEKKYELSCGTKFSTYLKNRTGLL